MIAGNLISKNIVPLRTSDSGEDALATMSDFYIKHLPIVNNKQLLGLLSEDDILNNDVTEPVGSFSLSMSRPYIKENDHIYEVLSILSEYQLTVIPVVDIDDNYLGLVTQEDLLRFFANIGSFTEPGSIIVLEMAKTDYSMAEMARIVESENAVILSSFITSNLDSTKIDVTLKINRQDIQPIISTFERFDYKIKASFFETDYFDSMKDRYDSLMSYLNV